MDQNEKNYDEEFQKLLMTFMISDQEAFTISRSIIKETYFDAKLKPAVRFILDYSDEYKKLPTVDQIRASTRVMVDHLDGAIEHREWFLDEVQAFCRHKAIEGIILDGLDLIGKGRYGEVEERVKRAMEISLNKNLGTDYFANPKERLLRIKNRDDMVPTGWKTLDQKLYGGFSRGALSIFAGGSGSGKSLWLQNLALNWAFAGLNVVYFSLELSEELVSMRFDTMVTGTPTKQIFKNLDHVDLAVRLKGKNAGTLLVVKMPEAGTTANKLRGFLKEYQIQTGIVPDAIIVDYLDMMYPNNEKLDPSNLFVKDKYTSEELRALAGELHVLCVSASQLNRQSGEAEGDFEHAHIAGGISKINTADNVFAIYTTPHMREHGEYQLKFLKTRSSSAVGERLKFKYDPSCMVISDADVLEDLTVPVDPRNIGQDLKKKSMGVDIKLGDEPSPPLDDGDAPMSLMDKIRRTRRH